MAWLCTVILINYTIVISGIRNYGDASVKKGMPYHKLCTIKLTSMSKQCLWLYPKFTECNEFISTYFSLTATHLL